MQRKQINQIISLLLFLIIYINPFDLLLLPQNQISAIAITICVAYLWITEAVALPVASLSLLVIIPLTGIMPFKDAAEAFAHPIIFLFLGGFMLGLTFEKWQLHKRIALLIVSIVGVSPKKLILSFMISTCFISMWISNTASTIIMLPIASSIISLLEQIKENDPQEIRKFSVALLISIAYSSTIGGNGTLIGSPPNALLAGFLQNLYKIDLSFLDWMLIGIPFMILSFIPGYYGIIMAFRFKNLNMEPAKIYTKEEIRKLGKLNKPEIYIIVISAITIILFVTRVWINSLLNTDVLSDTLIMMLAALSFFVLPVRHEKYNYILEWADTKNLAWGVLYLFGGALCLANMLQKTGIIELLGNSVMKFSTLQPFFVLGIILIIILLITEIIGGTAICSVFTPTALAIAASFNIDLLYFTVPITLAANVAYLTPVGTAANALIFSKGNLQISDMVKAGILIKLISLVLLQFFVTWWIKMIF